MMRKGILNFFLLGGVDASDASKNRKFLINYGSLDILMSKASFYGKVGLNLTKKLKNFAAFRYFFDFYFKILNFLSALNFFLVKGP